MTAATPLPLELPLATAGDLAVLNLESSLDRSWYVLARWPERPGTAERIVDEEQQRSQLLGDVIALDRLTRLSSELCERNPSSADTHVVAARIASMRHHFADAREHLQKAEFFGAPPSVIDRIKLTVAQALGENLDAVLAVRRAKAEASGSLEDLVPLGALLADLGEIDEANEIYLRAIQSYRDVSPFALAWVCFQLGVLWGETVPCPDLERASVLVR